MAEEEVVIDYSGPPGPQGTDYNWRDLPFYFPTNFGMTDPDVDNRAELQDLFDEAAADGKTVDLLGTTWRCDGYLTLPSGLKLTNGGLDFSNDPMSASNTNYNLRGYGSVSDPVLLEADAVADQGTPQTLTISEVNIAALGGLANDDMLFIYSTEVWEGSAVVGEIALVQEVSGTTVRISAPLSYSYSVANGAAVRKVTPVRDIRITDIKVIGSGTLEKTTTEFQGGFDFSNCRDIFLDRVFVERVNLFGVRFGRFYNCRFERGGVKDTPGWYGVGATGAGRRLVVADNRLINNRHAVTTGSSSSNLGGIPNFLTFQRNYVEGREASMDCHPGADNVSFLDNEIVCKGDASENVPHGIMFQGRNGILSRNKIRGNVQCAIIAQSLIAATIRPGHLIMEGNQAETINVANAGSYAFEVQIGSGSRMAFEHVRIAGNSADGGWAGIVRLQAIGGDIRKPIISGNRLTGGTANGVLLTTTSGNILDAQIDGNVFEMADAAGDNGVALQPATGTTVSANMGANTFKNVLRAVNRAGSVGTAILRGHGVVTDASTLHAGFLTTDTLHLNRLGVTEDTTGRTLGQADTGRTFTNIGTTARVDYALPTAVKGLWFEFVVADADGIRITAASGDLIRIQGSASATAGYIESATVGSTVLLKSIDATTWVVVAMSGAWTVDGGAITTPYVTAADLASTANAKGAALVGIEDAAARFIATTVEAALAELAATLAGLDQAVVLKGTWDASGGSFPGAGAAQAGWSYIVSVPGTVNGIDFAVGDRAIAIVDNASTSTYAANWFKADGSDLVISVAGRTGAITLNVADIQDIATTYLALTGGTLTGSLAINVPGGGVAQLSASGEGVVGVQGTRASANATAPNNSLRKARGTLSALAAVVQNDFIAEYLAQAHSGAGYVSVSNTRTTVIEPTPGAGAMGARWTLLLTPLASGTLGEAMRFEMDTGLSMFGANPVIDQNRLIRARVYTVAGLPAAGTAGRLAWVSNDVLGAQLVYDDGTNWRRVADGAVTSASVGTSNAKLDVEDQTLTGGARVTVKDLGTISSGTVTPDPGDRPMQKYTNGGAHTLAPGSNVGAYMVTIVNNGSAGAITTSGWTKVTGDSFTTTNGHKFRCHCSIDGDGSLLVVQAMQ